MKQRTNWQRLYDIAAARMAEIGLPQSKLPVNGGPSNSWFWDLQHRQGKPTVKMSRSLEALDVALGWPVGTSFRLARDPFVDGSDTALDEEDRLIHGDSSTTLPRQLDPHEQAIRDFGTMVMARLRALPEDEAVALMRRVTVTFGIGRTDDLR